jgi:hypothetical protein
MQQLITLEVLDNGHLKISLTPEWRVELEALIADEQSYVLRWEALMEEVVANSEYTMLLPEDIGALTSAPIIGHGFYWGEDANRLLPNLDAKVWWFPDYQVVDEFEAMLRDGFVIFTKAD